MAPASEKASHHIVAYESFWEVVGHRPLSHSDGGKRKTVARQFWPRFVC